MMQALRLRSEVDQDEDFAGYHDDRPRWTSIVIYTTYLDVFQTRWQRRLRIRRTIT